MACKNLCARNKATKDRRSSYYALGYKRCQVCEIFIKWSGIKCPCCQSVLRTKPHNRRRKEEDRINLVNHDLNT